MPLLEQVSVLAMIYSTNFALVTDHGGLPYDSVPLHPSSADCSSQLDNWYTLDTLNIVDTLDTLDIVDTLDWAL